MIKSRIYYGKGWLGMNLNFQQLKTTQLTCVEKIHTHEAQVTDAPSILKVLEQVMLQVEYHCFADLRFKHIDPLYKELCLIIAEVLILDKDSFIKINSSIIPVSLVQEIYLQIRNDHLRIVFSNFQNVSHRIYNKKFYLRTALYNAVFEIESHFVNDMNMIV